MAQPSSSPRERERERSHRHHRTISSTTLLLVLSLILAVLAVMLSIPNTQGSPNAEGSSSGVWNYLSPKRSQALVAREHAVAQREAEVAIREAELLAGAVGGMTPFSCPPVPTPSAATSPQIYVETPVQTVIKEVVKEVEALAPPAWLKDAGIRFDDLLEREARVAEREKDIGRREETIGRRETDVSRRETWIMEQLINLGSEQAQTVEEEIIYDSPPRRKQKELPSLIEVTETETKTKYLTQTLPPVTQVEILTETQTVTVPPAAHTRVAARPAPEEYLPKGPATPKSRPTTAVEVVKEEISAPTQVVVEQEVEEMVEEDDDYDIPRGRERTVTIVKRPKATRRPKKRTWFGGW